MAGATAGSPAAHEAATCISSEACAIAQAPRDAAQEESAATGVDMPSSAAAPADDAASAPAALKGMDGAKDNAEMEDSGIHMDKAAIGEGDGGAEGGNDGGAGGKGDRGTEDAGCGDLAEFEWVPALFRIDVDCAVTWSDGGIVRTPTAPAGMALYGVSRASVRRTDKNKPVACVEGENELVYMDKLERFWAPVSLEGEEDTTVVAAADVASPQP